jgi:tRNA(Ile)-lysidine synthase
MTHSTFLKRIKDTIKQHNMLDKGDRVLVAVSGGADSVCLLKVLLDINKTSKAGIIAANLDHCLRKKESAEDSMFVKNLCKKLKAKLVHKKIDVKKHGAKGLSVEERAREMRYKFLHKAAGDNKCNVIATGHTLDDQAETVLMRLIYGTSIAGVSGIPPVRNEKDIRVIRPLIRIEKKDILHFLKTSKLKHCEDSTNQDLKFLRNNIRHKIFPFLEKYNPRLKRSLANFADAIREDFLFIESEKKKRIKEHKSKKKTLVSIEIKDIILQPKALRREILKELFKQAGGNIKKLTYRHWMDMDYFLRTAQKGKSLDLPGNVKLKKSPTHIVFGK